jgi:hypothetical protein
VEISGKSLVKRAIGKSPSINPRLEPDNLLGQQRC